MIENTNSYMKAEVFLYASLPGGPDFVYDRHDVPLTCERFALTIDATLC